MRRRFVKSFLLILRNLLLISLILRNDQFQRFNTTPTEQARREPYTISLAQAK